MRVCDWRMNNSKTMAIVIVEAVDLLEALSEIAEADNILAISGDVITETEVHTAVPRLAGRLGPFAIDREVFEETLEVTSTPIPIVIVVFTS